MKPPKLAKLLSKPNKHGMYQALHPCLSSIIDIDYPTEGKKEHERWRYMVTRSNFRNADVIDIGANTGFFSFAAVEAGARKTIAIEGNKEHSNFILQCSLALGLESRLEIKNRYFDFTSGYCRSKDIAICLNVLHHIGEDFGDTKLTADSAKIRVQEHIRALTQRSRYTWLQIGFNWKGDSSCPLFRTGRKAEVIDFVREACGDKCTIHKIAIYNPSTNDYQDATDFTLDRFDDLGEFLNRPLFLLKSQCS